MPVVTVASKENRTLIDEKNFNMSELYKSNVDELAF